MKCCIRLKPPKKFSFCFVSPQNILLKVFFVENVKQTFDELLEYSTPQQVHYCFKISVIVGNGSHCGSLYTKALEMAF